MPEIADPDVRNPYLRANSLAELLAWNDSDFICCAYVTIVGRQPDEVGKRFYLDRLRRGHCKLDLLWQLRRSREGQIHDPGIRGLDRALKRAAWERKPLIGALVRAVTGAQADSRLVRSNRALLNELLTIKKAIGQESPQITNISGETSDPFAQAGVRAGSITDADLSPGAQKSLEIISRIIAP